MKSISVLKVVLGLALMGIGFFLAGCNSDAGAESNKDMITKGNQNLPPDDGHGQGLVSPVRPTMPGKGK